MSRHQKIPAIVIEIRRRAEAVVQKNRRKMTAQITCHTPVKVHGLPRIPLPQVEVEPFPPPGRVVPADTTPDLPSG